MGTAMARLCPPYRRHRKSTGLWDQWMVSVWPKTPRWLEHHTGGQVVPIDEFIDKLVAEFSGDVNGALKALLLINERLEAELRYLYEQVPSLMPWSPADEATVH